MALKSYHLYRHYDKDGALLYVGTTCQTLIRIMAHEQVSRWFKNVVTIKIEWFSTKDKARKAEKSAIKKEKPLFNVQLATDHKRSIYNLHKY